MFPFSNTYQEQEYASKLRLDAEEGKLKAIDEEETAFLTLVA
jgi:hypothetical protein